MNLVEMYIKRFNNILVTHERRPTSNEIYRSSLVAVRVKVNSELYLYCVIKNRIGRVGVYEGYQLKDIIDNLVHDEFEYIIYDSSIDYQERKTFYRSEIIRYLGGDKKIGMPMGVGLV